MIFEVNTVATPKLVTHPRATIADCKRRGQPRWQLIDNLGDANPIDHGGLFVYRDTTGVYMEEAELLQPIDSERGEPETWYAWRFLLDRCTFVNGVLSDNKYHPECSAWFAKEIGAVASMNGKTSDDMIDDLCSDDPRRRAFAYEAIGNYWGFNNLDGDGPDTFDSRAQVNARYRNDIRTLGRRERAKWRRVAAK